MKQPLTVEDIANLKKLAYEAGHDNDHALIRDELREIATTAVEEILEDTEVDSRKKGYQELIDEMITQYEGGFWASEAPAKPHDARFPELYIAAVPTLSRSHLTVEDFDHLRYHPHCFMRGFGELLLHFETVEDIKKDFDEVSDTTQKLLVDLCEAGYHYVRFSPDHAVCPNWPTFDS